MGREIADDPFAHVARSVDAPMAVVLGPGGEMVAPKVIDLDGLDGTSEEWRPYDDRTGLLVLGCEACRAVEFQAERLGDTKDGGEPVRAVSVAVCRLVDIVIELVAKRNDLRSREHRRLWPDGDQLRYRSASSRVKNLRSKKSPLRGVRDKLGAHLDSDVLSRPVPKVSPGDLMAGFGDALSVLVLSLNYPSDSFGWIRQIGGDPQAGTRLVETIFGYPLCVRWQVDAGGQAVGIERVILAEDPRWDLKARLQKAIDSHNRVVDALGLDRPLLRLEDRPDDLTGDRAAVSSGRSRVRLTPGA